MATQFYQSPDSCLNSPADSGNDVADHSWYRHSGQTGDFSSGRSASPNSADWRQSAVLSSKSSSLDPRRITPTLHASLVSEILSLRRELENKNTCIDDLETDLQSNKQELDSVNDRLTRVVRDSAAQKKKADENDRQLYRVTEDLVKERDQALTNGQELRTKLSTLTANARRQEEDIERWQLEWEQRSKSWENERQALQHRVNLTENHLRSLVHDLQVRQEIADDAAARSRPSASRDGNFTPTRPLRNASPIKRTAHRRNESSISTFSDRFITTSPQGTRIAYSTEKSLADELDLDDGDVSELDDSAGDDEKIVVDPNASNDTANKARKILGLDVQDVRSDVSPVSNDTSRPWEPLVSPVNDSPTFTRGFGESGQRHNPTPPGYSPSWPLTELPTNQHSGYMQDAHAVTNVEQKPIPRYADVATQYEPSDHPAVFEMDAAPRIDEQPALTLPVPSISVQPPSTAPNSPRQSISSPHTANATTQTDDVQTRLYTDSSMQTEEIRIDRRRFDAHLLGSASLDEAATRPLSLQSQLSDNTFQSVSVQEITTDLATRAIRETAERTALSKSPKARTSRPTIDVQNRSSFWGSQSATSSSMLASFHDEPGIQSGQSSLLGHELRKSKISGHPTDHENGQLRMQETTGRANTTGVSGDNDFLLAYGTRMPATKHNDKVGEPSDLGPPFRSRASSIDSYASDNYSVSGQIPRFPVPNRSSSRVQSQPFEDGSHHGSPNGSPRSRRRVGDGSRPTGIRKARSASSMMRSAQTSPTRRRRAVNRPAVHSTLYEDYAYEPSTDNYDFPLSGQEEAALRMNPTRALTPVDEDDDAQLIDAIASAMVGEWMWKYASKRSSFGVLDGSKKTSEETNRNKRWIWLSPHDRTIMWASKQPTSGSALMGRSSRKIRIKTVLDITDDNQVPKTANNGMGCFNRSIIVLSPDRALKISATSKERHYFWLMALSFLANPAQGPPKIPRLPSSNGATGKSVAANGFDRDDPVIEQSISKANANMLSQSRDATLVVNNEDAASSYTYHGESHGMNDRPDTSGSNDIRSIPRFRKATQSSEAKGKANGSRRPSGGFVDLQAPLSALRSLTARKTPSLASVSSRNNKKGQMPTSPSITSNYPASPSLKTDQPSQSNGTVRMAAFIDHGRDRHGQQEHEANEAGGGLGLYATTDDFQAPVSPRLLNPAGSRRDMLDSLHPPASRGLHSSGSGGTHSGSMSNRSSPINPGFRLSYNDNKVADGENEIASPSVTTDDMNRLGYLFDDEGGDPFKGF